MAEILASPFPSRPVPPRVSRVDGWLDGQRWKLTVGEDVRTVAELQHLRRALYRRGKQAGRRVRVQWHRTYLIVQAVPESETS